jgi:hypothetical protein
MNEAPAIVDIGPVEAKLNVPDESFGRKLKAESKNNWFPFKKSDKVDSKKIVHEIVK